MIDKKQEIKDLEAKLADLKKQQKAAKAKELFLESIIAHFDMLNGTDLKKQFGQEALERVIAKRKDD
jgi:hypothetical protein